MPQAEGADRWKDRRVLAVALAAAITVFPVAISVLVVLAIEWRFRSPTTVIGFGIWFLAILVACSAAFFVADRIARRALPLAILLKMNLVFPGRAPKRLAAARRAGSVRDLSRQVEEARARGLSDEPSLAAEKIVALAASLSAHDRTTRGHAERVRALTDMIAAELRLPPADRDRLRWSALLHDIGKLAVHPHVLNKPGELSDAEWEVIRQHPLEGARLAAPIAGWLGPWADTIAEHHERFDGRGYPFGRSGRQISLGGRIVAVADSYDVMTSMRSYKAPVSPERARSELAECAGSQFDPDVVKAFLAVSIWRLRAAAPLSWVGVSFSKLVGVASRLGTVTAHSVAAGVVAAAGIAGLAVADPLSHAPVSPSAGSALHAGSAASGSATAPGTVGGTSSAPGSAAASGATHPGGSGAPGRTGGTNASTPAGPNRTTTTLKTGTAKSTTTTGPTKATTTTVSPPTTAAPPPTTGPPVTATLVIADGPGVVGRPDLGDTITVTYSVAPAPGSFCSAWTASSHPDLVDPNVVMHANQPATGDDVISLVTDTVDCSGGFHFGSIDLGERGFFNTAQTVGGPGAQCSATVTTGCTRIHWDGAHTLTITLGQPQNGEPTNKTPAIAIYTPDPALGVAGTISSAKAVEF